MLARFIIWKAEANRMKPCKRCGERWCGTPHKKIELYGSNEAAGMKTYGSQKCRRKGPKR
jgi:hypothetical protein